MKIVLISPYPDIQSFGIRVLSASLKKEGHQVELIFLPRCFVERYEDKILDELAEIASGAGLIGISLMTNFFDNVVQVTNRLKKLNIPILWGGIHATIRPEECLNYADIVCIGEGEETIMELARRMKNNQDYHNLQSLWFKYKGRIVANKIRPLKQDLDNIPFPDYEYKDHYILDGKDIYQMREDLLLKYSYGTYLTMPTRGCPFGCSYCCNNTLNRIYGRHLVRKRSVANIINELMQVKGKLPVINRIVFDDDAFFNYGAQEIEEFSQSYKENIGLPLTVNGISPLNFSAEKLSYLVKAGLTALRMGIQSGSQRTKELYGRNYSNEEVEKSIKVINVFKDKIPLPYYDIILDNPWESEEDLIETLLFLSKLPPPYELVIYSLAFYPETQLYWRAKKEGIIRDDKNEVYSKYYYNCKKTYLNRVFFLLRQYSRGGGRIPRWLMSLLTDHRMKLLRLNWLLYFIVATGAIPFKMKWFGRLFQKAIKDICIGDYSRIVWYIKRRRWQKILERDNYKKDNLKITK